MFLGVVNELTATLLLGPRTRTLATEFWSLTSEIDYMSAATVCLTHGGAVCTDDVCPVPTVAKGRQRMRGLPVATPETTTPTGGESPASASKCAPS